MSSPSSHPLPVKLSPRARRDFIDILRHTGETWGETQLMRYRDKLDAALKLLGQHPEIGPRQDDLGERYRAFFVGSHVLVYRVEPQEIGVVRILHQRVHVASYLPKP